MKSPFKRFKHFEHSDQIHPIESNVTEYNLCMLGWWSWYGLYIELSDLRV